MAWNVDILTLYPDMFPGHLDKSLSGKALKTGIWNLRVHDIRNYGIGPHKTVDGKPAGGGPGMVLRADVLDKAIKGCIKNNNKIIYFSPKGKQLTQEKVREFSLNDGVSILCGHFEGIDQRVIEKYDMEEISIGDYILSGGEIGALILIDAAVRLIPGVLGNPDSLVDETFEGNLLEYPQYTKPRVWQNKEVPKVLLSGNHKKIEEWRKMKSKPLRKKN